MANQAEKEFETYQFTFRVLIPHKVNITDHAELNDALEPIIQLIYVMLCNGVSLFEIQQRLLTSIGD